MVAIQDQIEPTNNYKRIILKNFEVEDKCRKYGARGETIQHLLNGCNNLVATEYKARHNAAAPKEIFDRKSRITHSNGDRL